jgi:pectin methylesterase-like acyl-CoA thioesterase
MKFEKPLAVIGAAALMFMATDAVTYAATGSSLVLGRLNQANATTTMQNTGTTPALKLVTKSTATAPMIVNGKGKVTNLYADRAAVADNASKVGGKTVTQVVASVRPAGVIWVAKSGGQFTSLSAALASITNNGAKQRYVIRVAPGNYTETAAVALKNYVDVEGSGQGVTTISCACGSDTSPVTDGSSAVLQVTGPGVHVSVRGVTVNNTGSSRSFSAGIWTGSTAPGDVRLDDVTATATGATNNRAISNTSSSPTMTNVTATAAGGTVNNGIINISSVPTITNETVTAAGGTVNNGINNISSVPTITNATVTATATGATNYGVYNFSSSPTITNVTAAATAGTGNYGVYLAGGSALIRDSFLEGSTSSVLKSSGTIRILNTVFNGNTSGVGAAACIGALTTQLNDYTCL